MNKLFGSVLVVLFALDFVSACYGQQDTLLLKLQRQQSNMIFRGIRWGMTRNQVVQSEKEVEIKPLYQYGLVGEFPGKGLDYSALTAFYEFSRKSDSLVDVMLNWKGSNIRLYDRIKRNLDFACGKSIFVNGNSYWKSSDGQTIHELHLNDDGEVEEIIFSRSGLGSETSQLFSIDFNEYQKSMGLTYKAYLYLETNMSYENVRDIFGFNGKEQSESSLSDIKTVIYQWQNDDGSNVIVTFQNDRLVSKAQAGLK